MATVAVDGAENAGLLAVQILSVKYGYLRDKLKAHKEKMKQDVIKKDEKLKRRFSDEKAEMIYEGKAKVYKTDDEALYIVEYKDDATAFNGLKKEP